MQYTFSCWHFSKKKRGKKKDAICDEEHKRLSTMAEEDDEDDCGIMIRIDAPTPTPSNLPSPKQPRKDNETSVWDKKETPIDGKEGTDLKEPLVTV